MATLAANSKRTYEFKGEAVTTDIPVIASDIIYEGAAVGESSSTGNARPLQGGDAFLGFALRKADNSAGAIGDVDVLVALKGYVKLSVTSVTADDDLGIAIYASDDDTFTTASTGNTQIGKLERWISGTTCIVYFESTLLRSI